MYPVSYRSNYAYQPPIGTVERSMPIPMLIRENFIIHTDIKFFFKKVRNNTLKYFLTLFIRVNGTGYPSSRATRKLSPWSKMRHSNKPL